MNLEEWLKLTLNLVLHTAVELEVERLALNRCEVLGDVVNLLCYEVRSLVDREFLARCHLTETAVISLEMGKVLCTGLHAEGDRTVENGNILWYVRHIFHAVVHRE